MILRRASLWLPPFLYAVAIFHFSSQSDPLPEVTAHVWDKLLHTVEYTGLGLLVFRALAGEGLAGWTATLGAGAFPIVGRCRNRTAVLQRRNGV